MLKKSFQIHDILYILNDGDRYRVYYMDTSDRHKVWKKLDDYVFDKRKGLINPHAPPIAMFFSRIKVVWTGTSRALVKFLIFGKFNRHPDGKPIIKYRLAKLD